MNPFRLALRAYVPTHRGRQRSRICHLRQRRVRRRERMNRCERSRQGTWIASAVGITLRRPEKTARDLLAECLILVYPPIAHPDSTPRDQPDSSCHSRSARKNTPYIRCGNVSTPANTGTRTFAHTRPNFKGAGHRLT